MIKEQQSRIGWLEGPDPVCRTSEVKMNMDITTGRDGRYDKLEFKKMYIEQLYKINE